MKNIYLVWDVYQCAYVGAVNSDNHDQALAYVNSDKENFPDTEGMGYEVYPTTLYEVTK